MNLVWFITIGTFILSILGEFGQIPFGSPLSVGLIDLGVILSVGILVIWQVGITRKIIWPKWLWWLVGWWGVSLLSIFWSGHWVGVLHWLRMVSYTSLVWLGLSLVNSQVVKFEQLIKIIVRVGLVLLIGGVVQLLVLPDFTRLQEFGYDPHQYRLASTFLDPNFCGLVFVMIGWWAVWAGRQTKKIYYYWLAVGLFIGVVLTLSRTAYLVGLVSGLLIGWRLWRWRVIVGMLVVLLVGLMIPNVQSRSLGAARIDVSASERFESWRNGIKVWQESPVLGVGYGNLRAALTNANLRKAYSEDGGNSGSGLDSSFIVVLASTGIVGAMIFFGWWWVMWQHMWRVGERGYWLISLWIGWIVGGQFINAWFYPILMMTFYLLAGAVIAEAKKVKD